MTTYVTITCISNDKVFIVVTSIVNNVNYIN